MAHDLSPIVVATYGRITVELRDIPEAPSLEDVLRMQQNCRSILAQGLGKLEKWSRHLSSLELTTECALAISLLSRISSEVTRELQDFGDRLAQSVHQARETLERDADCKVDFPPAPGHGFIENSKAIWLEINRLLEAFDCHATEGYVPPNFLIQRPEEAAFVDERGLSEQRCQWRNCRERSIAGLAFCYKHYFDRPES